MPQNPIPTTLYVSQLLAGAGISLIPANGTGIVTVTSGTGIGAPIPAVAYNTNTNASGTVTLTAPQCAGGSQTVWVNCTGTQSGAFAIDLPTVAALVAAIEALNIIPTPGGTFVLNIMNNCGSSETGTITTALGWTLTGTMTVTNGTYRSLLVTITSLTAFAAQSLGEYTIAAGI